MPGYWDLGAKIMERPKGGGQKPEHGYLTMFGQSKANSGKCPTMANIIT